MLEEENNSNDGDLVAVGEYGSVVDSNNADDGRGDVEDAEDVSNNMGREDVVLSMGVIMMEHRT